MSHRIVYDQVAVKFTAAQLTAACPSEHGMSVRKFLDLSTGHLSPRDHDRLTEILADKPPYGSTTSMTGDRGWLIYVPAEPSPEHWSRIPALVRIIARARELDCDYILLDADGPVDETLPFFDED